MERTLGVRLGAWLVSSATAFCLSVGSASDVAGLIRSRARRCLAQRPGGVEENGGDEGGAIAFEQQRTTVATSPSSGRRRMLNVILDVVAMRARSYVCLGNWRGFVQNCQGRVSVTSATGKRGRLVLEERTRVGGVRSGRNGAVRRR